ncbi:unnamed protein product [Meganyctiphanes norvegica]|uniref:Uncharacterized protein n=1 Tax=Meganyctiphanes norvegica TaxID=48144 RepID=A0AAV2Q1W1_MEGNR
MSPSFSTPHSTFRTMLFQDTKSILDCERSSNSFSCYQDENSNFNCHQDENSNLTVRPVSRLAFANKNVLFPQKYNDFNCDSLTTSFLCCQEEDSFVLEDISTPKFIHSRKEEPTVVTEKSRKGIFIKRKKLAHKSKGKTRKGLFGKLKKNFDEPAEHVSTPMPFANSENIVTSTPFSIPSRVPTSTPLSSLTVTSTAHSSVVTDKPKPSSADFVKRQRTKALLMNRKKQRTLETVTRQLRDLTGKLDAVIHSKFHKKRAVEEPSISTSAGNYVSQLVSSCPESKRREVATKIMEATLQIWKEECLNWK